jgi:hypothetical protein
MVDQGRSQMTVWPMRFACCIPKAIDTHSEYVIFIAFPRQQWLHVKASVLRFTYTARFLLQYDVKFKLNVWLVFNCLHELVRHSNVLSDIM